MPTNVKTVLIVGDSLSAEYGLARDTGWVSLLSRRIAATRAMQQPLDWQVVNASISGETTSGGLSRLPTLLKQHRPAIVVIELGANDGLRGLPLTAMRANLNKMIDLSKQAGAKVVLTGMQIPPNYGRDYTSNFSASFGSIAKSQRIALVPFLLATVVDRPEWFQSDRIHPTQDAQTQILDNVWPVLEPLLRAS